MGTDDAWAGSPAPSAEVVVPPLRAFDNTSQQSFESLMGEAAVVEGYALADKKDLLGLPFIITGVTFRYARVNDKKEAVDYVSLEAVTMHNAAIVLNDGSTGVRRQVVQYLQSLGAIDEGVDADAVVATDPETPIEFDLVNASDLHPLRCPRGLRKSDYENEFGAATTYYLG